MQTIERDRKAEIPAVECGPSARARFVGPLSTIWHLHIRPLWRRFPRALPVVIGVGLGAMVLVATGLVYQALGRPFATAPEAAVDAVDWQVSPLVEDRLPVDAWRTVRDVPGVETAVPVAGGLTSVIAGQEKHGALLVGSDCTFEELVGDYGCKDLMQRAEQHHTASDSDARPLIVSRKLATALDLEVGSEFALAGGQPGDAVVFEIIDQDELGSLNAGFWLAGSVVHVQELTQAGPNYLSTVLLATDGTQETRARVTAAVDGVATVGEPGVDLSLVLWGMRGLVGMAGVVMLIGGALVASNAFALFVQRRRRGLALAQMFGGGRIVMVGIALEGAILGAVGALVFLPLGVLMGRWMTGIIGEPIVAGTGAQLSPAVNWLALSLLAAGGGVVGGIVAAMAALWSVSRDGPRPALRDRDRVSGSRHGPSKLLWIAGLGAVTVSIPVVWVVGRGYLPRTFGYLAVGLAVGGVAGVVYGLSGQLQNALAAVMRRYGRSGSVLAMADLGRDQFKLAAVAATIGIASFTLIGVGASKVLALDAITAKVGRELAGRVYVLGRSPGDQMNVALSQPSTDALEDAEGVERALPQRLAVVRHAGRKLNVLGTDPDTPRRMLVFENADEERAVWDRVAAGEIIVPPVLAARERVDAGDTLELNTIDGPRGFKVAAVIDPTWGHDNGIGDLVFVSNDTAVRFWNAHVYAVIVEPEAGVSTEMLAARLTGMRTVAGIETLSSGTLPGAAVASTGKVFDPLVTFGVLTLVVSALGVANFLVMNLREKRHVRATWRITGYDPRMERRVLLYEGLAMAFIGALVGAIGGLLVSYMLTTASPALITGTAPWRPVWGPVVLGSGAVAFVCVLAVIPAALASAKLDVVQAIREES